jgi:hypothetical protein
MNKKQAKTMKRGYRDAGAIYWSKEMAAEIRKLNNNRKMWTSIAFTFAASTAVLFIRVIDVL